MSSGVWAYMARRVLLLIPLMIGLSLVMFMLVHAAPGDPVLAMMGERAASNPQFVEQARKNLGLDKSLPVQYITWVGNLVRGDFGTAYTFNNKPVMTLIGERFWITIQLQLIALILSLVIAIPIGIVSAMKQYSMTDNLVTIGSFMGLALPNFWLALLLQLYFAVKLGWVKVLSAGYQSAPYPEKLTYFILPVIVLTLPSVAYFSRFMRSSMLEVINQDYMTVARAKGLSSRAVLYGHAMRNALIPMITVVGLQIPRIIGGAVIIEQIFGWPGLGDLAFKAIGQRDYPVILAITLLSGVFVMVVNIVTDFIYVLVDPRLSLTDSQA